MRYRNIAAFTVLAVITVLLGGFLILAARADFSGAQPVPDQQAEIPQTGNSGPGGYQGNSPGITAPQPAALMGLAASLAGALVLGLTVMILSRKKTIE